MTQITVDKSKRLLDLDNRWNGYIPVALYLVAPYLQRDTEEI